MHSFEFEEEGDQIVMEINDGGAAANEFASEVDEELGSQETDSEVEQSESDGEITSEPEEFTHDEVESEQLISSSQTTPQKPKKRRKESNRRSVEDRLDTLSSTLLAMKELLVKSGISEPDSRKAGNSPAEVKTSGKSGNDNKLTTSQSEMTIYESALENLGKVNEQIVD